MKLGIVGSRQRNSSEDKKILKERILDLNPSMLISGGCRQGADHFAEELAWELEIPILIYYPKLKDTKDRREVVTAYYARNRQIAFGSEHLIALVAPGREGGTENTIKYFRERCVGKLEIL